MKEKLVRWVLVASAVLTAIVHGSEIASKIWSVVKMINIDRTFIVQIGLIIILVGSGIMYIKERVEGLL